MKYLKCFESYDKLPNSEFYHQISQSEFEFEETKSYAEWSDSELNIISKLVGKPDDKSEEENLHKGHQSFQSIKAFTFNSKHIKFITKLKDEWFMVMVDSGIKGTRRANRMDYYKCDQFDGLVKLIEDISKVQE
jgi:hypothetical protein